MDKKLNRTIGYKNTTEVVINDDKTTKVVRKNKLSHPLDDPFPGGLGKNFKKKYENIELVMPEPSKLKLKNTVIDILMDADKENTNKATFEPVVSLEGRSKRIVEWLEKHCLINKAGLCQGVGMDKSNFKRVIDSEKPMFKEKVLVSIELLLKLYGF